jgi:hypothetical protein
LIARIGDLRLGRLKNMKSAKLCVTSDKHNGRTGIDRLYRANKWGLPSDVVLIPKPFPCSCSKLVSSGVGSCVDPINASYIQYSTPPADDDSTSMFRIALPL